MHYVAPGIHETWVFMGDTWVFMDAYKVFYGLARFFYLDSHSEGTNHITVFVTSMI